MELLTQINAKKIFENKKAVQIINELKKLVYTYDKDAQIILFGSRARGDWHEESDWDFLILTNSAEVEMFNNNIRNKIANEIEFVLDESIFVIVKNKSDWEENYAVTNLYESILEEGIAV